MRSKIMYNQEQKDAYITYENKNKIGLINYFKRLSVKEREFDKDIADMEVDELKSTLKSLYIRREDTIGHLLSLVRGYINWANLNGRSKGGTAIDKITANTISSLDVIKLQMIKDPEHLRHILKNILDEVDYENRTIRDSLVFWLLYSGVELSDLNKLRKTDLNVNDKIAVLEDGRCFELYEDAVELWKRCVNITFLEKRNGKSKTANEYSKYELLDSEYLFRPILSNRSKMELQCSENAFINIVSKTIKKHAENDNRIKMPPENIKNSGAFYRLLMHENEGIEISIELFKKYFNKEYAGEIRKLEIDYMDWKVAFEYS